MSKNIDLIKEVMSAPQTTKDEVRQLKAWMGILILIHLPELAQWVRMVQIGAQAAGG